MYIYTFYITSPSASGKVFTRTEKSLADKGHQRHTCPREKVALLSGRERTRLDEILEKGGI